MALAETPAPRSISPWNDPEGTALRRRPVGETAPGSIGMPVPYGGSKYDVYPPSQTSVYSPLQRALANRAFMQKHQQGYMQQPAAPELPLPTGGVQPMPIPGVSMPSARPPIDMASAAASRTQPGYAPRDWSLGRTYTPPASTEWMLDPDVIADRAVSSQYPGAGPVTAFPPRPQQTATGFGQQADKLAGTLARRAMTPTGINSYRRW